MKELYIDEDEFWDVSEIDDEIDELLLDINNKGKIIYNRKFKLGKN